MVVCADAGPGEGHRDVERDNEPAVGGAHHLALLGGRAVLSRAALLVIPVMGLDGRRPVVREDKEGERGGDRRPAGKRTAEGAFHRPPPRRATISYRRGPEQQTPRPRCS